jgi:hypothetical protein
MGGRKGRDSNVNWFSQKKATLYTSATGVAIHSGAGEETDIGSNMAGDNQHYIPQQLLKGFAFRGPDGSLQVWEYSEGQHVTAKRVKEVAAAHRFYSEPGPGSLDEQITNHEHKLAPLLKAMRKLAHHQPVDSASAAGLILHLIVRSDSVRSSFSWGVQQILLKTYGLSDDAEFWHAKLGFAGDRPSTMFRKSIVEEAMKRPEVAQSGLPAGAVERILFGFARENFPKWAAEQSPAIKAMLASMYSTAPEMVKDGHNKALARTAELVERRGALEKLTWRIVPTSGPAVLPDCVAVGIDRDGRAAPLHLIDNDRLVAVAMPLNTKKLLIGSAESGTEFPSFAFNLHAAACCESFFLSRDASPDLLTWSKYVGARSRAIMIDTLKGVFDEFEGDAKPIVEAPQADVSDPLPTQLNWSVRFLDCAEEKTAHEIADVIREVALALGGHMSLARLDGITFAYDYPKALAELDRGYPARTPLTTSDEPNAIGIARAPLVVRDGVIKAHIVVRGEWGHALIDDDKTIRNRGIQLLASQFAQVACTEMFDRAFPGVFLNPLPDAFTAARYEQVDGVWFNYFTARMTAGLAPDAREDAAMLFAAALNRAAEQIPDIRLSYRYHGNLDELLHKTLKLLRPVLHLGASVLGHNDGLPEDAACTNNDVEQALARVNLTSWFNFYRTELRKLWDRSGRWTSLDEFLALNIHLERLLWQFGMVMWLGDDGVIRVEVPLSTDMSRLPSA